MGQYAKTVAGWERRINILKALALKVRLDDIASQYRVHRRTIHRWRDEAIINFEKIKSELTPETKEYLKRWAGRHKRTFA